MTRTLVKTADVLAEIVSACNGQTVNGGTLSVIKSGAHTAQITAHSDAPLASFNYTWELQLR